MVKLFLFLDQIQEYFMDLREVLRPGIMQKLRRMFGRNFVHILTARAARGRPPCRTHHGVRSDETQV
uniref:Uncharacterized protein n=1 Tax=Timema monikensis TaxID=170555 RepID=A0A7R9E8C6_9NEOP|nr:unnamed protein product [Timema monikensis]